MLDRWQNNQAMEIESNRLFLFSEQLSMKAFLFLRREKALNVSFRQSYLVRKMDRFLFSGQSIAIAFEGSNFQRLGR